jgi:hypothetical protein
VSEDIAERSLALLKDERTLLDRSMIFQTDVLQLASKRFPITDSGLRAATAIACYTYDMLLCGWNSLIHGFYSVALHSIRSIEQAIISEIAVTLDPEIARAFLKNKLQDGVARMRVQEALAKEDSAFSKEWGDEHIELRTKLHKFQHINIAATAPSIIIANDLKSASPTYGGFFIKDQCKRTGILYASFSFSSAVWIRYTLRNIISDDKELDNKLKDLIDIRNPIKDNWQKEMSL